MEITVNGQSHRLAEAVTVAGLLQTLNLAGRYVAVEVNLELVPRGQHAVYLLADGDRVEVVTLVGGG
ncbi:MAG: sulfur carrier protein ThiS [Planctomycetes bacterium]|nr:sulfur carrier protein ThiS [Planctomycetota bacterium]